jgi:hypothetical protein
MSGNLVTGHRNLRHVLLREIGFSAPRAARKATARLGVGARLMVTASPGVLDSGGHDAGPRRAS